MSNITETYRKPLMSDETGKAISEKLGGNTSATEQHINISEQYRKPPMTDETAQEILSKIEGGGGGATNLGDLDDVYFRFTPDNKDVLKYDATQNKWVDAYYGAILPDIEDAIENQGKVISIDNGTWEKSGFCAPDPKDYRDQYYDNPAFLKTNTYISGYDEYEEPIYGFNVEWGNPLPEYSSIDFGKVIGIMKGTDEYDNPYYYYGLMEVVPSIGNNDDKKIIMAHNDESYDPAIFYSLESIFPESEVDDKNYNTSLAEGYSMYTINTGDEVVWNFKLSRTAFYIEKDGNDHWVFVDSSSGADANNIYSTMVSSISSYNSVMLVDYTYDGLVFVPSVIATNSDTSTFYRVEYTQNSIIYTFLEWDSQNNYFVETTKTVSAS